MSREDEALARRAAREGRRAAMQAAGAEAEPDEGVASDAIRAARDAAGAAAAGAAVGAVRALAGRRRENDDEEESKDAPPPREVRANGTQKPRRGGAELSQVELV